MAKKFELKWLAWEVTRRCNLNCVHCRSASSINAYDTAFDLTKAKILIDQIKSFANPVIVLSGGEPLLRHDLFEIAQYGTSKGLRMALATNGTLVDDATAQAIKKSGIQIVSLSLDGPNASVHDDFRQQPGAFDAVIKATQFFKKYHIPFLINSSFTKRNQHLIPQTLRLAKKLGAKAWYMFMIVPMGRGEDLLNELISKEDYEEILKWHFEMERQEDEILVRPTCAPHYYRIVPQMNRLLPREERLKRRTLQFSTGGAKGCLAGQLICMITAEGNVLPCSYFPKAAGNVFEQHLRDIWENSELFAELRDFSKYKGRCGACEYLHVCGGCRARAYAVYGDYMAEEPFCNYVPKAYLSKHS